MPTTTDTKPTMFADDNMWIVRLTQHNGRTQEFRCSTKEQARQLALMLTGGGAPKDQAPKVLS